MIWAGIIGSIMVGLTANYIRDNLETLLKKQGITFRRNIIFMQDNACSHAGHKTTECLQQLCFCRPWKINWPNNSLDLNPIEIM